MEQDAIERHDCPQPPPHYARSRRDVLHDHCAAKKVVHQLLVARGILHEPRRDADDALLLHDVQRVYRLDRVQRENGRARPPFGDERLNRGDRLSLSVENEGLDLTDQSGGNCILQPPRDADDLVHGRQRALDYHGCVRRRRLRLLLRLLQHIEPSFEPL